ncbi:MAG: deoxyribose-phosphate aldolase [Candidatus Marinimicrobia bacterium]|nr:deoxyribose-phosphate aldolase [Candidatus Neomarinimicrobiota bacterium]
MTIEARLDRLIGQVITQTVPGVEACESGVWQCRLCQDRRCSERDPAAVRQIVAAGANRVGSMVGIRHKPDVAAMIDHTLLKSDATEEEITRLCREAREYGFASVCVNPVWVRLCKELLVGTAVKVATVIGFPLGAVPSQAKAEEVAQAVADGADELDMVMNIGFLKSGRIQEVEEDIRQVVQAAGGRKVKVIIETALLTDEEKIKACILAERAGARYVKTSTGFSQGGATVHDIALMRHVVGERLGVKAAGGIHTAEEARQLVAAGASRIGSSASIAIVSNGAGQGAAAAA